MNANPKVMRQDQQERKLPQTKRLMMIMISWDTVRYLVCSRAELRNAKCNDETVSAHHPSLLAGL
jgi:hypothetical protein